MKIVGHQARGFVAFYGFMIFTSGAIMFKTDKEKYKIRNISQCEDVVSTLHKIMKEPAKESFDV